MSAERRKREIVEELENICPACDEEFDAVEFGPPEAWSPHGHIPADMICCAFSHGACFYHDLENAEEVIEKFGMTPAAVREEEPEYDTEFVTGDELDRWCPFASAGWTVARAERILAQVEDEMAAHETWERRRAGGRR